MPVGSSYLGDIDESNTVNIFDLLGLLRIINAGEAENDRQFRLADINMDGEINIFDLLNMLGVIAGRIEPEIIGWGPPELAGLEPVNVAAGGAAVILINGLGSELTLEDFSVNIDSTAMELSGYTYGRLEIKAPDNFSGGMATVAAGTDTLGEIFINVLNQNPPTIEECGFSRRTTRGTSQSRGCQCMKSRIPGLAVQAGIRPYTRISVPIQIMVSRM